MQPADFFALLDELFEFDDGTISGTDVLKDIEGWSSLTFVGLIALIDEEYEVAIPPNSILACETVGDLLQLVEAQLNQADAA
jgi:acyl carrier protein